MMLDRYRLQNCIRSLYCLDSHDLPDLPAAEHPRFFNDPVGYFLRCEDAFAEHIWNAVAKRQKAAA